MVLRPTPTTRLNIDILKNNTRFHIKKVLVGCFVLTNLKIVVEKIS